MNVIIVMLAVVFSSAFAKENVGKKKKSKSLKSISAGCAAPSAKSELNINNVRTTILDGGDMWWDPMVSSAAQYEIPIGSGKNSVFSGSLWIGGIDASSNLRVAGQTYRQWGIDFWPGPIDQASGSITPQTCLEYDRLWNITFQQIKDFVDYTTIGAPPGYTASSIPDVIKTWPGNSPYNSTQVLAPYVDVDGDGIYNWEAGDYPDNIQLHPNAGNYYCEECVTHPDILFGDQTIWWVFNDVGNIHTETGGAPIGLEVQAQAFGFATNDDINNMTFYKYKLINRSSSELHDNYFGVNVDSDLGWYLDDYVGCDVPRGLGYTYNGDDEDEGPAGYGLNPPALGVDFFEGPKADPTDTSYTDRDCGQDPLRPCKQLIMSRFVYYNNDGSNNGNPTNANDYYNYLRGIWRNGTPMTYGGDGFGGGNGATTIPCKFMFPGDTDHEWEWGTGGYCGNAAPPQADWFESVAPDDRRFVQSAGPFTLASGAVNYITIGVVWARATQGGPLASVNLLRITDDKAQALFDNCFKVLNGPDAPDMTIRELDKEIILSISNSTSSNNYQERYIENDPFIHLSADTAYKFQGYQIFQLVDHTVSSTDLHNLDKARLIAQVDVKDNWSLIVNHYLDPTNSTWVPVTEVNGANKGIVHSFRVLTDAFATGDDRLINHKNYFYMVIAYGFNSAEVSPDPYNPTDGQNQPYIAGRRNLKVYTAIPHNPSPENNGQVLNSIYGSGPEITRVEGTGNGYVLDYNNRATLDLTSATVYQILNDATGGYKSLHPTYQAGRGPVEVKVYDPVKVPDATFRLWLDGIYNTATQSMDSSSRWLLVNESTNDTATSESNIDIPNEQLFPDLGLSVNISQVLRPMESDGKDPGFVEGTMTFSDPIKAWLTGVSDEDVTDETDPTDWITSINSATVNSHDKTEAYEKVLDGTWAPYALCDDDVEGPGGFLNGANPLLNLHKNLPSVDVVFTSDKSKWSECMVLEVNGNPLLTGGVLKLHSKKRPSLDMDGNIVAPDSVNSSGIIIRQDSGRSWFPGYAINVETGERLNIMFGEDSWLAGENGNDMLWNPTSNYYSEFGQPVLGGRHYIYIVNANHESKAIAGNLAGIYSPYYRMGGYDGCDTIQTLINVANGNVRGRVFKNIAWVGFPMLIPGKQLSTTDVTVRLRVTRPYAPFAAGTIVPSGSLIPGNEYVVYEGKINHFGTDYIAHQHFTAVDAFYTTPPTNSIQFGSVMTAANKGFPLYTFSTHGLVNNLNNTEAAKNALDLINVVPNPYYAYSSAEGTLIAGVVVQPQLDNRIRIVNLPPKCTISIYTVNGTLIKRFNRDVASDNSYGSEVGNNGKNFETAQDWDLKNHKNVPVASGLYLIHVEAPGLGERTIKWFGVMRPVDLDAF